MYPSRLLRKTNIKLGNKGPVLNIIRNWGMSACIIKDVYCETFFKTFLKRGRAPVGLIGSTIFCFESKNLLFKLGIFLWIIRLVQFCHVEEVMHVVINQ